MIIYKIPATLITIIIEYLSEHYKTGNDGLKYFGILNKYFYQIIKEQLEYGTLNLTILYSNFHLSKRYNLVVNGIICNYKYITNNDIINLNIQHYYYVNFTYCNNITDELLEHFAKRGIHTLYMPDCNKITDSGLKHFANSSYRGVGQNIHTLYLSECNTVTPKGFKYLIDNNINTLYLGHGIMEDSLKYVQQNMCLVLETKQYGIQKYIKKINLNN